MVGAGATTAEHAQTDPPHPIFFQATLIFMCLQIVPDQIRDIPKKSNTRTTSILVGDYTL